ncbi:MAG: alpha-ribazole phosphatase [Epulopiscium sp.]|nr:alpha-ribazole phosphatase [Candidatus Epulonipiscium sp.]
MKVYLIRHGQTDLNLQGRYYGSLDPLLNEEGIKEIEKVRDEINKINFDRVYSSSSRRCLQSLKICGEDLYKRAEIHRELSEINFGIFEGKTYKEISKLYPEDTRKWEDDWMNFCPPGGESFIDFYKRVTYIWKEIIGCQAQNILIMAHSGTIKSIFSHVMDDNPGLFWNFMVSNASINIIGYDYGNLYIEGINKEVLE